MADSPLPFDQRLILVTGGSSGIGRAVAQCLAGQGARVLVNGRDPQRLAETLASLAGAGHAAVPAALTGLDQASALVAGLAREYGPLRGVVHAAGIHSAFPLGLLKQEHLAKVLGLNVEVALGLLKGIRSRGAHGPGASVVLISSVMGLLGAAGQTAYCASKGALVAMTRAAALELAGEDVRVNCVAPGCVATDMLEGIRARLSDEQFEAIRAQHPLGFGQPEDVAQAVAFLLGDGSRWITGTTLVVDGGYSAS